MVYKFALTSTGPLSGKTTLAKHLRDHHGFVLASHITTLVESFVEKENNTNYPFHEISVDEVFANKEFYRIALQEHSLQIGFSSPEMAQYWTERTIAKSRWTPEGDRGIVFDSFRGEVQAEVMRDLGFTVVQLVISDDERENRAESMGKSYSQIIDAMGEHPELELGVAKPDVTLHSMFPVGILASILLKPTLERVIRGESISVLTIDEWREHNDSIAE